MSHSNPADKDLDITAREFSRWESQVEAGSMTHEKALRLMLAHIAWQLDVLTQCGSDNERQLRKVRLAVQKLDSSQR